MTPYENLANAIVVQAANDYREALNALNQNPKYKPAIKNKSELEQFFSSHWFDRLTKVDGEYLLSVLQKEVS